jgi:hypothetical protein
MDLRALRYGVEVETVGQTRATVAQAIQSVVGGTVQHVGYPACYDPYEVTAADGRSWRVVADSSLSSVPAELRAEVVTPILTYADLPLLQEVIRALRQAGARTCPQAGMHVHVGAERFTGKALANLAKLVYKQEPLILMALGVSPDRLARYTKPLDPAFIARLTRSHPRSTDAVNRLWYGQYTAAPQRYDKTRYQTVNFGSFWVRSTVEFRFFESTLHAGKVKAAVQFCLALCARALTSHGASARQRTYDPASAKYDLRVFLISALKMNGDEFKTARKHLLARMPGDAAFKHGRPSPGKHEEKTEALSSC